jgi:hypothetical protein
VVRALGSPEEKADIIGPHKWPGFVGEGKETLAYGRAATAFLPEGNLGSHCTQPSGLCRPCRLEAPGCVYRSATGPGYWSRFGDPGLLRSATTPSTTDGEFTRRVLQTSAKQGSRQRCSPGIGRGNEHNARPCGSRHRNRAIRLLPVLGAWTD